MRRDSALAAILVCITPFGLVLLGQEDPPRSAGQTQNAPPAQDTSGQHPHQHQMPDMQMPQKQAPSHESQQLQEPEDPNQRTGSQTPIPELLGQAAKRPCMRLKDFEDLALANNPTLEQANALVQRSAGQARQAGLFPNPLVGYQGEEIRGGSFRGGEQGAFVQQTIVLGGKLGLRRRVLEEQRREDELGLTEQRYRLLADVDRGFYAALAAQETVRLRQNLLRVALDASETAHQLVNVGQADAPDLLEAEVEAEQAKVDYVKAQRDYIQAFQILTSLVGKSELAVSPVEGRLDEWPRLDPEQIIEQILRESPSVKRAQQAAVRAEAQLQSARREPVPDLQIRAGMQQDRELNEITGRPVGAIGFATAGISIPIFNRNQGNVEAAKAELERARQEITRLQLRLRQSIQPLLQTYLTQQIEAERYKNQMIPRATRAYRLYLSKYSMMASAYPQVIISQRTLVQLDVGYIRTLENLWMNAIALQNFTLTGGLDAPTSSGSASTTVNVPSSGASSVE
jgi:cobalt-zinc-cadmium efflux system outer membrane protein